IPVFSVVNRAILLRRGVRPAASSPRLPSRPHEGEGQMDEWHDFFLATSAAAGVLTGLVFVGVSINLEKIVSQSGSGLTGRAAEALILLLAVLTASILLLVPGQSIS